jgi:Protein of unknown function (DUF3421)
MPTWRVLLLGVAALVLAGCADLLGVEPLSGSDGGSSAASDGGAGPEGDACEIAWVDSGGGAPPPAAAVPYAVPGSGAVLYVCRVSTPTLGVIPGKLLPGWACYYSDGQTELTASSYEVLVPEGCALAWGPAAFGDLPVDALVCGEDGDGGLLYSCRVGTTGADPGELGHVGWSTDHECVYSLGGASLTATDFDVLTAE